MDKRLGEFVRLLRRNSIRVSLAEEIDAFRVTSCLGLAAREPLKDGLRTALVKRGLEIPLFDELFDLYFFGLSQVVASSEKAPGGELDIPEDLPRLIAELEEQLARLGVELPDLGWALLRNDRGRLERLLREALRQAGAGEIQQPFQEGRYTHAAALQLGLGGLVAQLEQVKEQLGATDAAAEEVDAWRRFIDRRLRDLHTMIKRAVRLELEQNDPGLRDRQRLANLAEKNFYYLSEDEIQRMKEAVTRLARRLKNVVAVRRRHSKRGKFDVKATLRSNLQCGGVPFRLRFDRRRREKPRIVVLCDVSDSVRNVSRFMLQFVYSLQDLYSRVRSFIFVSELGEVTRLFEEREIGDAIEAALSGESINVYAHSDFGKAFSIFHRDFIDAVTGKTTVLVLGDARNNYNTPREWILRDIRRRAKQVVWLNPENHLTWGFGDSEMDRYAPHCDIVRECRNLKQLYQVVDALVA